MKCPKCSYTRLPIKYDHAEDDWSIIKEDYDASFFVDITTSNSPHLVICPKCGNKFTPEGEE